MELLYNPDQMPESEIKATFVAREKLVDDLLALVVSQPDGAGTQHVVIIAPRGMGKTTVLLMIKFAINDRRLADRWLAVKFPEESYGINDLADFWLETLNLIAAETGDEPLQQRIEELKSQYPQSEQLQEAALATIKDWRRKHHKRLLLLVENFDQLLAQINDEHDNARLRDVLMNNGTMMLIGGATTFFKEARAYDQPLYNFFKIYNLADLKFEQIQELLRRRAQLDRIPDFEAKLKVNRSRLRALEYFTGGNPRLVLMLYRVVSQSDVTEVRHALEKLLDEVTPYYKAKVEILSPQQRKILDHIARVSGESNEGLTPTEMASAVRLPPNQVSAQLKRLSDLGYVRSANLRGRSSYYMLSEPLYAIWHQMRFGRNARQRMQWLITFLRLWYASEEMEAESGRLETRFHEHLRANHLLEARDVLEHHRYLVEAMESVSKRTIAMEAVIRGHLELGDIETVKKDLLASIKLVDLSEEALTRLSEKGCISDEQVASARTARASLSVASGDEQFAAAIGAALLAIESNKDEEALQHLDKALEIKPDNTDVWFDRGVALGTLGRYEEALASFDRALALTPDEPAAWANRGLALGKLGRYEEALTSCDRVLALTPDDPAAWTDRGGALHSLDRYEEALANFDRALALTPDNPAVWFYRGNTLQLLGRYEEALASFDRVLALTPDHADAWAYRGGTLYNLDRYEEALTSFDRALALTPDHTDTWTNRGNALYSLDRYEEALTSFGRALALTPDNPTVWFYRGDALYRLDRHEEALASFDRALALTPDHTDTWTNRGNALYRLDRHEEALASFDRALALTPDDPAAWANRGSMLQHLGHDEEALASFDRALALTPDLTVAWFNRGNTLHRLGRHEEALASFDQVLMLAPDLTIAPLAWFNRGITLDRLGRHEEALASFDQVLAFTPDHTDTWTHRGDALYRLGRHEEALASYDRALALTPDLTVAWFNRGNTLDRLGRHEEALASYDRALALTPDLTVAWFNRGSTLDRLGRYEEALASFDQVLALTPDHADTWTHRGSTYMKLFTQHAEQAEFDLARHYWTKALESGKRSADKNWLDVVAIALLEVAKSRQPVFVRQLIAESDLEEPLFPLVRAIDYLQTGDVALIEKLSPEVKDIVEEVVETLQTAAKDATVPRA